VRIVIDMQALQTGSAKRGIGRYACSLTSALLDQHSGHEVILLFNARRIDTLLLDSRIKALIERVGVDRTMIVPAPDHIDELHGDDQRLLKVCKLLRETMLETLKPDFVVVPSLFEFEAVLTVPQAIARSYKHATIAHDFIPLTDIEAYMPSASSKAWYYEKLQQFRNSDIVLCNSQHTREDAINRFGFDQLNCINIFAGSDLHERFPQPQQPDFDLTPDSYILYCATYDPRKNVGALIAAYAQLPEEVRHKMPLVLGGSMHAAERERVESQLAEANLPEPQVRILGFVEDDVLAWLYKNCRVFVFPSLSEGLGLPPIEAMTFGAPVIVSNRTSLPEVVGAPDQTFDPDLANALTDLLLRIAVDDSLARKWSDRALKRSKAFSWSRSAKLALSALDIHGDERSMAEQKATDFENFIGEIASIYGNKASADQLAPAAAQLARAQRELERLAAANLVDSLPPALNCGR
jgi:glycosyltransferase involved in cell wall biosynthesis